MIWRYVINLEEAGCAGPCGAHLREGRKIFQTTDPVTDEMVKICPVCLAECLTWLFTRLRIQDAKEELRMMREG